MLYLIQYGVRNKGSKDEFIHQPRMPKIEAGNKDEATSAFDRLFAETVGDTLEYKLYSVHLSVMNLRTEV